MNAEERKAALVEQEQADEENKRALEEFDETLALQQEQQRLADLLSQKRRNREKAKIHIDPSTTTTGGLCVTMNAGRAEREYTTVGNQDVLDRPANSTHIQNATRVSQITSATASETPRNKENTGSCPAASVIRFGGFSSDPQASLPQGSSPGSKGRVSQAAHEIKTRGASGTPFRRLAGVPGDEKTTRVCETKQEGMQLQSQARGSLDLSRRNAGNPPQWASTVRPYESEGAELMASEPGPRYTRGGALCPRKRRFAGLFSARDEQASSKHRTEDAEHNGRDEYSVTRAFPGENAKEKLLGHTGSPGPASVPRTEKSIVSSCASPGDELQQRSEQWKSNQAGDAEGFLADAGAVGKQGLESIVTDPCRKSLAGHKEGDSCLRLIQEEQGALSKHQQKGSWAEKNRTCAPGGRGAEQVGAAPTTGLATEESRGRAWTQRHESSAPERGGVFKEKERSITRVPQECPRRSSSEFRDLCCTIALDGCPQPTTNVTPAKRANELLSSRLSKSKERASGSVAAQARLPPKAEASGKPESTQKRVGTGDNCDVQEGKFARSQGIRRGAQTKRPQPSGGRSSAVLLEQCQITKYFKKS